jgi:hypothetical protein
LEFLIWVFYYRFLWKEKKKFRTSLTFITQIRQGKKKPLYQICTRTLKNKKPEIFFFCLKCLNVNVSTVFLAWCLHPSIHPAYNTTHMSCVSLYIFSVKNERTVFLFKKFSLWRMRYPRREKRISLHDRVPQNSFSTSRAFTKEYIRDIICTIINQ